jgi:hypothetical protein
MTNTLNNTVSRLRVGRDGVLTHLGETSTAGPTGQGAPPFASDEALSKGRRQFLYVLSPTALPQGPPFNGPGDKSLIDVYRVGSGGSLTHVQTTPANLPDGVSGLAAR